MKWIEKRAEYQKRFDDLSQENIQGLITELNQATANFIAKGGLSQDPNNNPDYNNILNLTNKAENIKQRYSTLNDEIVQYLAKESKNNDLAGILSENGELQKQINKLEKITSEMKVDVESAVARDELLRTRNTDITTHKLFVLGRPVRRGLVPYLWVLGVLFIGVGLVIFRSTLPSVNLGGIQNGSEGSSVILMIRDFLTNRIVLGSLLGSALIVILFLSLKIGGVFGK
jgi:hypothetical protein